MSYEAIFESLFVCKCDIKSSGQRVLMIWVFEFSSKYDFTVLHFTFFLCKI